MKEIFPKEEYKKDGTPMPKEMDLTDKIDVYEQKKNELESIYFDEVTIGHLHSPYTWMPIIRTYGTPHMYPTTEPIILTDGMMMIDIDRWELHLRPRTYGDIGINRPSAQDLMHINLIGMSDRYTFYDATYIIMRFNGKLNCVADQKTLLNDTDDTYFNKLLEVRKTLLEKYIKYAEAKY